MGVPTTKYFFIPLLLILAACGNGLGLSRNGDLKPSPGAPTAAPAALTEPEKDRMDEAVVQAGLIPREQQGLRDLEGASRYQIELLIDPEERTVKGKQKVAYTNREDLALQEIYIHLFPNILGGSMEVANPRVNGRGVEVGYESLGSALRLSLPEELQPGAAARIEMDFSVSIPGEMESGYGLLSYTEGVMALDSIYPSIAVYDERGWNKEPPPPFSDLTFADASFYDVLVTLPSDMTVVASGVEVEKEVNGEAQTIHFTGGPLRDFYLAASREFLTVSGQVGGTRVNSTFKPGGEAAARRVLETALAAVAGFNRRFGEYPYTELDLVSTPMLALGIEYPGIVGISLGLYEAGENFNGLPASTLLESVAAHETAHQWFYNMVGNDQINEPWLDESITQYVTALYFLDVYGDAGYRQYRKSWLDRWQGVEKADIPLGLPAADYSAETYGAIIYGRGPLFLEALAEKMGQEKFDAFLRMYVEENKWKLSSTGEFRELAEGSCSCSLEDLFTRWVY